MSLLLYPQNSTKLVAVIFLDRVLACFGASAEVLMDQGREFLGVFKELCTKALIDHHTTSRDHSKAHGLVKQVVQTTKHSLRKYELLQGSYRDWDLILPWIAMGYRFSRHVYLAFYSPYQLFYRREPILPSSIKEKLALVVDLDEPNIWIECLQEHTQFF